MINVLPINDIKEHAESTTCECKPSIQFENGEMIVVHNSFDGRELIEDTKENKDKRTLNGGMTQ